MDQGHVARHLALLTCATLTTFCAPRVAREWQPDPTPPPEVAGDLNHASLVAYGRSLRFETEIYATDQQDLTIGSRRERALAGWGRIEPQVGAHLLTLEQLAEGRIVARIIYHGDGTYEKLGVRPGTNWVYIRWKGQPDRPIRWHWDDFDSDSARAGDWEALIVNERDSQMVVKEMKPGYKSFRDPARQRGVGDRENPWPLPRARFVDDPDDAKAWIACQTFGCCCIGGGSCHHE